MTTARPKKNREPSKEIILDNAEQVVRRISHVPCDLSSEAGVLGSMILDPGSHHAVLCFFNTPEAFCKEENRIVFGVMTDMLASNTALDAMTLHTELRNRGLLKQAGGIEYIKELANSVPTSAHVATYSAFVREKWMKRRAISALITAIRGVYEDPADNKPLAAQSCVDAAIASLMEVGASNQIRVAKSLKAVVEEVKVELASESLPGLRTGLVELDEMTGGLHKGELIILAARPSMGKTSLAVNMLENICLYSDHNSLLFSMEQRDRELIMRMLASHASVNSHSLRMRRLDESQWRRVEVAQGEIGVENILIDDTPALTLADLYTKARRIHSRRPLSLIVLDYLQLMECDGENRQQQITKLSRGLKALARELNVPVLCLSQLNRASANEKRLPQINDLRESGSIEQDADVVMLLHREAVLHRGDEEWLQYNQAKVNEALLIVAKQRNGPCDNVKLTFHAAQTRFTDYRPPGI